MNLCHWFKLLSVLPLGVLLLSSCASSAKNPLVGASWVALQDVTYPPRRTTVSVQDGRVLERGNQRDRFAPNCGIVSTKGRNQPLTISKGTSFKILRVNHTTSAFNVTTIIFDTSFRVEADGYPDIGTIQCQVWGSQGGRHMSTEAIEKTMEGVFSLEPGQK